MAMCCGCGCGCGSGGCGGCCCCCSCYCCGCCCCCRCCRWWWWWWDGGECSWKFCLSRMRLARVRGAHLRIQKKQHNTKRDQTIKRGAHLRIHNKPTQHQTRKDNQMRCAPKNIKQNKTQPDKTRQTRCATKLSKHNQTRQYKRDEHLRLLSRPHVLSAGEAQ